MATGLSLRDTGSLEDMSKTIITNAIPKVIFDLIKTKFTTITYTKENTICQK